MRIAIAGFGIEGRVNYDYWNVAGNEVTIVDERPALDELPAGAMTLLGEGVFSRLDDFDMVIRTASLNPRKITTQGRIWSGTNEFFARCPAPIIGVTGTKGKGTTSSLITSILREAGKTVHLVGNIGTPALEVLSGIQADDIVVYELSSFQLWDIERSPHIAVVLGVEPDHLDVHEGMDDYIGAKANIVRHQLAGDITIFNQANVIACDIADQSVAQKIPYPFALSELLSSSVKLPGAHNLENASAAVAAVGSYVADEAVIARGLAAFSGLPHRLKFVRTVGDVSYYDDSIATTPGSAIAAIRSFSQPKVLILGGSDKGAQYDEIITLCGEESVKVIAIGQTGERIAELCEHSGVTVNRVAGDMTAIVEAARQAAQPGGVVILSPASASFDMFTSYTDRGDQYVAAVSLLTDE